MPADPGRQFVDTNVFVYAYDRSAGAKGEAARALVGELWGSGQGALSLQVLQELFVVLTRKVPRPLSANAAGKIVADLSLWRLHEPTRDDLLAAIAIHGKHHVSLWDALILRSAT